MIFFYNKQIVWYIAKNEQSFPRSIQLVILIYPVNLFKAASGVMCVCACSNEFPLGRTAEISSKKDSVISGTNRNYDPDILQADLDLISCRSMDYEIYYKMTIMRDKKSRPQIMTLTQSQICLLKILFFKIQSFTLLYFTARKVL